MRSLELSASVSGVSQHFLPGIELSIAGSLVPAAVTAAIRASAVHLWWKDSQIWRKGTVFTILLWIISLAAHLVYESVIMQGSGYADLGESTLLLCFAVSLFVQRALIKIRADRMRKGEPQLGDPFPQEFR